jgi:hypothetical protein
MAAIFNKLELCQGPGDPGVGALDELSDDDVAEFFGIHKAVARRRYVRARQGLRGNLVRSDRPFLGAVLSGLRRMGASTRYWRKRSMADLSIDPPDGGHCSDFSTGSASTLSLLQLSVVSVPLGYGPEGEKRGS